MILDQPLNKLQMLLAIPTYYAISPPEGRRFVTRFPSLILRERLSVSKNDAIDIALSKNWILAEATLRLDGKLYVTLKFILEALGIDKVYLAVKKLLILLAELYPCVVAFKVITNRATGEFITEHTRSLNFSLLQLFHYYNKITVN